MCSLMSYEQYDDVEGETSLKGRQPDKAYGGIIGFKGLEIVLL